MTANSFGSRAALEVAGERYEIYRLDAAEGWANPFSLKILLENLLRNEDGANITASQITALAGWDPTPNPTPRSRSRRRGSSCRTSPACPPWSTWPRCARPCRPRRRPHHQPADAGRTRHRPLRAGRRVRQPGRVRSGTSRSSSSATASATSSCAGARRRCATSGRAAGHRHRAPGEPRVPGPGRDRPADGTVAYPDTLRGHRLAHHHDERPGRARLGRGRHRGGGGHARPADLHADPEGGRLPAHRRAAQGATATDLVLTVTEMLRKHGVVVHVFAEEQRRFYEIERLYRDVPRRAAPRPDARIGARGPTTWRRSTWPGGGGR